MSRLANIAAQIEQADIYGLAKHTPLERADSLSGQLGRPVWLKREDLQDVFSFKIRGAANRIAKMSEDERARGVVAASAGNHAQGIAASAARHGMTATIFMPVTTPEIKTKAVQARGGVVKLVGDTYDAACDAAITFAEKNGAIFIHPFDEDDVIAGQGTIGKEILSDLPHPPAAVYVSVGGGGLMSGIGAYLRTHAPKTRLIAVESEGAPTLKTSLAAGQPTALNAIDGFADGVAVKMIGANTFGIIKDIDPELVLVSNDEICAAVKDVFEQSRTVVEPAGALALAGLIKHVAEGKAPDGDCVAIISGANVNFDRIGYMVERAELGAGQEILFAATLPERPGAFMALIEAIGDRAISEFNYRYSDPEKAHVLVGIKVKDAGESVRIFKRLEAKGMHVTDLTHNRLAKDHLRHMVGGVSSDSTAEYVYSFEFPERPGALRDFLTAIGGHWNISLFHYRNHGASSGNVLCGFQVPNGDMHELEVNLGKIGLNFSPEHENPAFKFFLKS